MLSAFVIYIALLPGLMLVAQKYVMNHFCVDLALTPDDGVELPQAARLTRIHVFHLVVAAFLEPDSRSPAADPGIKIRIWSITLN